MLRVVDEYLHAKPACFVRQRLPDRSEADDSDRGAGDAVDRQSCGKAPVARPERTVVADHAARKREREREDVLGHFVRAVDGDVRHRDPAARRLVDCDVVGSDAVAADHAKPLAGRDDARRHMRKAGEDRVGVAHELDKFFLRARRSEHGVGADFGEHGILHSRVGPGDVGDEDLHSPRAARPAYGASRPERLLDPEQLVVLRKPLRLRDRADLDLPARDADGEVGERRVLRLAGARRDHRSVAGELRSFDDGKCLADRPDLVHLHQHSVRGAALDAALEPLDVRREEIVAEYLHPATERSR